MTPLSLLVYAAATWRVSSLLVCEDGPADAFARLRAVICRVKFLSDLFSCIWCCSIWVGAFWVLFDFLFPLAAVRVALLFALSAAAVMIQRWMEVMEKRV